MTKKERGQATVEMALVLVFFVLILFAIIDFGRIFYAYLTLVHASREGARVASLGATNSEIVATATSSAASLTTDELGIEIHPQILQERVRGTNVSVNLTYSISFTTPLLEQILVIPFYYKPIQS